LVISWRPEKNKKAKQKTTKKTKIGSQTSDLCLPAVALAKAGPPAPSFASFVSFCFIIADRKRVVQHFPMKRFLFPLVIFPISLLAEGGLPDKPYIYVQGRAEIKKPADTVTIRFQVVARAPDQAKASQDVQAKAAKVFALLKAHNVGDKDLIAYGVFSQPEFEQEGNNQRRGKVIGFTLTREFQLKLTDVSAFPKLVDDLAAFDGVELSNIDTGFSKENEVNEQVWEKALAGARERAEKTLKRMGMKIDSVFAVSPVPFPQIYTKMFSETEPYIVTGSAAPEPEYHLGSVSVTESVHVIYLISPAR
jgi:uncharacterized protein YggE